MFPSLCLFENILKSELSKWVIVRTACPWTEMLPDVLLRQIIMRQTTLNLPIAALHRRSTVLYLSFPFCQHSLDYDLFFKLIYKQQIIWRSNLNRIFHNFFKWKSAFKNVNSCLNTNIFSNLETSEACIIKLFTAVIYGFRNKLGFLSLASLSSLV